MEGKIMRSKVVKLCCAIAILLCASELWSATGTVTLSWTAPGNNGLVGLASQYDIRYSTSPITNANWAVATKVSNLPAPKPAGNREIFKVTGLLPATTYYLALKTADSKPNWSLLSNNALKTTCPVGCNGTNGNINGSTDGRVDLTDLALLTLYLTDVNAPTVYTFCTEMGNVNGSTDGVIDIADLSRMVAYMVSGVSIAPCP
jgi:hypothetical protein